MPSDLVRRPARPFGRPNPRYEAIGREVGGVVFTHPLGRGWWIAFAAAAALLGVLAFTLLLLFWRGVGIWGNNIPVTWALDIVSYDWWIGIACGGLLVSALLLLLDRAERSALNRIAETMSLIAAAAAAVYPIIHLGRPWFFFWNLPYPNTLLLWPQFRSPLVWDAFDIISFLGTALCFWYVGLLPDLAQLRDRAYARALAARGRGLLRAQIYGIAALGWRGSAVHWHRWMAAQRVIALFAVPLVLSLQTGAAVMFAGTLEPGWHDTLLPTAFFFSATLAGVGALAVLVVLIRAVLGLDALIAARHLDLIAWLMLGLGLANVYCYAQEMFMVALAGSAYDFANLARRVGGPHAWAFWAIVAADLLAVQLFWLPRLRRSAPALLIVGLLVCLGSWGDHFMVIVDTLQHDFLPSSSRPYRVSAWEVATFAGSVGLFLALLLLFLRYLPVLSLVDSRRITPLFLPEETPRG